MSTKPRIYTSDDIDVSYDVKRCIHAEECVKRLSSVFDVNQRPWIQPENASADAIANTIEHCPSGALQYERKDGGAEEAIPDKNSLKIEQDGPIYIRGNVTISLPEASHNDTRVALCRCGMSENKPYCDNSHKQTGFSATDKLAANEAKSKPEIAPDGQLMIEPSKNGPVHISGNFEIISADGDTVFKGNDAWLCRCGGSNNKPFCDGTHNKIGFVGKGKA